jgi:hypothetical protein
MYLVEAEVLSKKAYANAEAVMTLLGPDAPTSQNVHFFMSTGEPYRVYFSRWTVSTWGELAASRQGRLMEPYITTLQQKNSLHLQRQGQPRIPQAFYLDGNVAALLEDGDDPDDNGEVSIPKTRDPTEDVSSRAWQRAKSRLLSIFTK